MSVQCPTKSLMKNTWAVSERLPKSKRAGRINSGRFEAIVTQRNTDKRRGLKREHLYSTGAREISHHSRKLLEGRSSSHGDEERRRSGSTRTAP